MATQANRTVTLIYDREKGARLSPPKRVGISITGFLSALLARAAHVGSSDETSLSFTSLLAGMITGADDPVSLWLKGELERQGVDVQKFATERGRPFDESLRSVFDLPSELSTSWSARQAIEAGQGIATALGDLILDVRHLIAAYPTLADWHDSDFATLGIDRLAWARRFAEEMVKSYEAEKWYWRKYADRATPVPLTSFNADVYNEKDLLGIDRSVDALALLIASTRTETPLSIGVFGPWGSGKSFFMRHLRKRLWGLAEREQARVAEWKRKRDEGKATDADAPLYYGQIAQVEFNAWHYNEGNLVASLVDHLFRNLRVLPGSADKELAERRAQVLLQMNDVKLELQDAATALERTQKEVTDAEKKVEAAVKEVREARRKVDDKREELDKTTADAEQARKGVDESIDRLVEEAEKVNAGAVATVALAALLESPVVGEMKKVAESFSAAVADWRGWLKQVWSPRGAAVVLILIAIPVVARMTNVLETGWAAFVSALGAAGAATAEIRAFIRKRRAEFDVAFEKLRQEETARVNQERAALEQQRQQIVAEWTQRQDALRAELTDRQTQLQQREAELAAAGRGLAENTKLLEEKVRNRGSIEKTHQDLQARLARLSSALLLDEFITERSRTDEYHKQLSFLALVRRDFERLSDLIASANKEWLSPTSKDKAPLLNRIVLYIDDLDRCSEETVLKVLEAVHLLLAFPLFVCVVAVDPRWVEKCLRQKHQFGFAESEDEDSRHLTVGDYLEKIFQIPIWMNPIEPEDRASVVRSLLGPVTVEEAGGGAGKGRARQPIPAGPQHSAAADGFQAAIRKAEEVPDPLQISATEARFVDEVAPLLSDKPRALIRFVNTYRLLKATLSHVDLQTFVSGDEDSPHKVCMMHLAFFTGCPRLAPRFVQELRRIDVPPAALAIPQKFKTIPVSSHITWLPETSKYLFHRDV